MAYYFNMGPRHLKVSPALLASPALLCKLELHCHRSLSFQQSALDSNMSLVGSNLADRQVFIFYYLI